MKEGYNACFLELEFMEQILYNESHAQSHNDGGGGGGSRRDPALSPQVSLMAVIGPCSPLPSAYPDNRGGSDWESRFQPQQGDFPRSFAL